MGVLMPVIVAVRVAASTRFANNGSVAVVVQMFFLGCLTVFAAVAFEHAAFCQLTTDLAVEQLEHPFVKAEMGAEGESDLRVLPLQACYLFLDALDQHAGE